MFATQSRIGVLAALMEGFQPDVVARAYNASELEIRRQASICLDDVLKEFGLRLKFTQRFGGIQSTYPQFAQWISEMRNVHWSAVLSEVEGVEAAEVVAYLHAFAAYEAEQPRLKLVPKIQAHQQNCALLLKQD